MQDPGCSRPLLAIWVLVAMAMASCRVVAPADFWPKVELDLAALDADGLRGAADGKVSVAYEFCIPDTEVCRAEVRAIDRTVQFMPGSRGRIGAGPDECLCVGETRADYREVLGRLAALPYVRRIIECHFE